MSTSVNKFEVNDRVVIIGSEELVWVIKEINKNQEHNYIYSIKLTDGIFDQESLPWIPECLLSLKS